MLITCRSFRAFLAVFSKIQGTAFPHSLSPCQLSSKMESAAAAEQFKRKNWASDETLLLVSLVAERRAIIKGKCGPGITSKQKKAAWADIAAHINEAFSVGRTPEDCERRWYSVQSKSRQKISSMKKHHRGTGNVTLPILGDYRDKLSVPHRGLAAARLVRPRCVLFYLLELTRTFHSRDYPNLTYNL